MDWLGIYEKTGKLVRKNWPLALILSVGISLMLLPGKEKVNPTQPEAVHREETTAEQLETILSQIAGAGRVKLLLTQSSGPETVYQKNENTTKGENGSIRSDTVVVTDASRNQSGLIARVDPPVYLGAVVVCQGADRPAVRLAVVEAVSNATGLSTDRITVLKMK